MSATTDINAVYAQLQSIQQNVTNAQNVITGLGGVPGLVNVANALDIAATQIDSAIQLAGQAKTEIALDSGALSNALAAVQAALTQVQLAKQADTACIADLDQLYAAMGYATRAISVTDLVTAIKKLQSDLATCKAAGGGGGSLTAPAGTVSTTTAALLGLGGLVVGAVGGVIADREMKKR